MEIVDLPNGMNYADGGMEEMAEQFGVHGKHCEAHKEYEDPEGKHVSAHSHTVNFY